jgi:ribonuclease-3
MSVSSKPSSESAGAPPDLQKRLGHSFRDSALLATALRHASAARRGDPANERLEFLGDRVLGLIIADHLMRRFPKEREGALAQRHARLVSRESCAAVARSIDLGGHLTLPPNDLGAADNATVLGDAMEAVIAALYLDGGLAAAEGFVKPAWDPMIESALTPPRDPKTRLQEWAMARALPLPDYRLLERSGPEHAPIFKVEVGLSSGQTGLGEGGSKRLAQSAAAAALLERLEPTS